MPHTAPDTAYSAPPSTTDSLDAPPAPTPAGALFATRASRGLVGRLAGVAVLVAIDGLVWIYDLVETWNHIETFASVSVVSPGWGIYLALAGSITLTICAPLVRQYARSAR